MTAETTGRDYVIDLSRSPGARLQPVPVSAVTLSEGFWGRRFQVNAERTIPYEYQMIKQDLFAKFQRAADPEFTPDEIPAHNRRAREANLFRWLEAAAFGLSHDHDPDLDEWMRQALDVIEPVQDEDGYLHAMFAPHAFRNLRWTDAAMNELYAAGHMIQGAIAHKRTTGDDRFIAIARRFADHIYETFSDGGRDHRPSHPVIEMALVELYRETRERKYLDLACYFIEHAGAGEMEQLAGHAVQILFLMCGLVDAYMETGEDSYRRTSDRLWKNMVEKKMYVTGAVGGRVIGEAVGQEFELPHEHGYAETCAAIGSTMWNWRNLHLDGDARYADLMELCWYNSIISGVSLDGTRFFYENPHASGGRPYADPWRPELIQGYDATFYRGWIEAPTRQDWFWVDRDEPKHMYRVACCPPNLARTIAQLPAYFYSTSGDGVWVHMYGSSTLDWKLADGTPVKVVQTTAYPWEGEIQITVQSASPDEFSLFLRIPGWCRSAAAQCGGRRYDGVPGSYLEIRRTWSRGDSVELDLFMTVELIVANPLVAEARERVALKRGPIVYCIEGEDNAGMRIREAAVVVGSNGSPRGQSEYRDDLLDGVATLKVDAIEPTEEWGPIYTPIDEPAQPTRAITLTAIPYFAWNNRGPGEMTIWLRRARTDAATGLDGAD